jgi:hypothetical protein
MDLRRSDLDGLTRLAELWKTTPGAEFEAMLTGVDLTSWQDVIQYLRSLGMRENPQIVKMNICLSNDIRLTLEGAGAIQAYCRDNRIADKPFVAMLKENIAGAEPVVLGSYAARAKLKREVPLAPDDARVKEVIARWDALGKHFRNIQRFEFVAPGGVPVRFDVSIVRENAGRPARTFQEARVTTQPPHFEIEVELTAKRENTEAKIAVAHIIRGLSWILQGRQRSYVLVSQQGAEFVRDSVGGLFRLGAGAAAAAARRGATNRNRGGPQPAFRFPGPQPATLERRHISADVDPGAPSLRTMPGGYNVTDKADGLRCLLYVADNGKVFLMDAGGRVYATGKQVDSAWKGLVLDGEWVRRDRTGRTVSHYLAFDIMADKGGNTAVAGMPFKIVGAMLTSAAAADTREARMAQAVGVLGAAAQTVRGVPATQDLQIGMKTFRTAEGADIFREAAVTLESAASAKYNTDGLIFTPNAMPLPIGRGTWPEQLKWKPPHENTIDFLVVVDRERTKTGAPTSAEAVGTKFREDSGQTVRYKTLRLFVGSSRDVAFADPRHTVLSGEALPMSLHEGEWREVEFRPTEPRDPMAAICYVAIGEGAGDPAGAAPAALALDTDSDLIRCTRSGDVIQSDMIVEMAYHPERSPGWRWEPVRVRHDKTERWLAQQATGEGKRGGTMNADWVANAIWTTLHNPVSEDAVRTGRIVECAAPAALAAPLGYSVRRTPTRDLMKTQCMRNFHNEYIKRRILLGSTLKAGATVCDLAMGRGEDIAKWIAAPAGHVFGCDVVAANLNDPQDGAYRRLMDKMVALGGRDRVPAMVFAQADAARRLSTGDAGLTAEDQELLRREFGPAGGMVAGADVVSCMFAMHYMFRDENTLAGFLTNLADTVKVGGFFVGCDLDGDTVARAFAVGGGKNTLVGRDGVMDVWMMTRRYGAGVGSSVPPSAAGLGLAVDVDLIAGGESSTQYLISWPYMQARLAEVGLELLTAAEVATLGLPAATQMFSETAAAADPAYEMSEALARYSYMHRWWIMRRRVDRRPALPLEAPAPPAAEALTQMRAATLAAEMLSGAAAAGGGGGEGGGAAEDGFVQIELPEPPAPAGPPAPFLVNSTMRTDPENRLGDAALEDWPRYLTLGIQHEIADMADPSIKYPSVAAAIASARYQLATDKPAAGPTLFRVEGRIHQAYATDREKLQATGASAALLQKSEDDEMAMAHDQSMPEKMKKYKAVWNKAAWDEQKEMVYQTYLKQRYTTDAKFRNILQRIKERSGEIMYANGVDYNEMGVGVDLGGRIVGGDNKIGKWLMALTE